MSVNQFRLDRMRTYKMAKSPAQASAPVNVASDADAGSPDKSNPAQVQASDAGKKGRKAYESKADAFKAIATQRVNTAVAAIDALGDMACARYEYTNAQIMKIDGALRTAIDAMGKQLTIYLENPASAPAKANKIEL